MSNSLREKLLGLGFKAPEPEPRRERPERGGKPAGTPGKRPAGKGGERVPGKGPRAGSGKPGGPAKPRGGSRPARSQEEIDLAKAYAIRAQKEKQERIEAERLKQEEAARRRAAKAKVADLLRDKALNVADAEHARHFEYGGKIKRVYVTPDQLKALNAGELAVVQLDGRYLLVPVALADEVAALLPSLLALKVDPNAPAGDDPYADPRYQVPDDLVW
ncbi:MAG: nucleoprotein/polynucleotide-associated enzyme [Arenimonas sp.]|nr:nucleoprotein/polynucleotide-associated enzyme [Arenimonas sp.]